jgi:hypothetical protein
MKQGVILKYDKSDIQKGFVCEIILPPLKGEAYIK